jgi:uncharacterized membrane protein
MWPWCALFAVHALLSLRLLALGAPVGVALATALGAGAGIASWTISAAPGAHLPALGVFLVALLAMAAALVSSARLFSDVLRTRAHWVAACFVLPLVIATLNFHGEGALWPVRLLLANLGLGGLLALSATGARSSRLFAIAVASTFIAQATSLRIGFAAIAASPDWLIIVLILLLSAAVFTLWPLVRAPLALARPGFWRVAALAGLPWYGIAHQLVIERHGDKFLFLTTLGFALFVGGCALQLWPSGEKELDGAGRAALAADSERAGEISSRSSARAWFSATALLYASYIVALQIDREPFALGMAVYAAALAALWTRCDHRALKYLSVLAIALASAALCLNHALDYLPRAAHRIANWNAYLLLLPALAAGWSARRLGSLEVARVRGLEHSFYAKGLALASLTAASFALLLSFVWLNLEVADAFGSGEFFQWSFQGAPRSNLALSIAWAAYALVLLGLGVGRALSSLRWASLVLLLMTIAKVFLIDLGHLDGLYRVASMLGLALSLLLVSFLYQRFVFRRTVTDK